MGKEEKAAMIEKKPPSRLNLVAFEGLRGLLTLHLMINHFYFKSLHGMSLFFVISGFVMTVAYGKENQKVRKSEEDGGTEENVDNNSAGERNEEGVVMKSIRFYRNRLARIVPMFYLSNIVKLLLNLISCIDIKSGGEEFLMKAIFTVTISNSWFQAFYPNMKIYPFSETSWTMSTMTFFYLVFPLLLPLIQRLSSNRLRSLVVWMFYLQLLPMLIYIWDNPDEFLDNNKLPFQIHYRSPFTRLPVFVMGMASGLLRLRHHSEDQDGHLTNQQSGGLNPNKNFFHDLLPWGICGGGWGGMSCVERENKWRWKVEFNTAVFVLSVFFLHYYPAAQNVAWLFSSHTQLMVVYGLTDDGQKSFLSMICRLKITRTLGQISMTSWLLHLNIRQFLLFALNHPECYGKYVPESKWRRDNPTPYWLSPLLIPIILLVCFWVNKWIEQPIRDCLKSKK